MMPPATAPVPPPSPLGGAKKSALNGFELLRPYRECPGWINVYNRAVDSGRASLLKALAVKAFALAIAWLPGHTLVGSPVDVANAQSCPLRFTTAAHISVPWNRPPASPPSFGAVARNCFNCPAVGSPEQFGWLPSFWDQAAPVLKQTRRTDARSDRLGFIAPPALADNGPGAKGMPHVDAVAQRGRCQTVARLTLTCFRGSFADAMPPRACACAVTR